MKQDRLKEAYEYLRAHYGIHTQIDLAEAIRVTRPALSSAMNGNEAYLTKNLFQKICAAYPGVFNLDYLLNGEGNLLLNAKPEYHEESKNATALPSAIDMSFIFERIESANNKTIEVMEAQIARLEDSIKTKDKLIQVLEARIKDLELCNGKDKETYPYPMSNFASDTTNNNDEI